MYRRYTVMILGDNFNPDDVIDKLDTDLVVNLVSRPNDLDADGEVYGIGFLSLISKNEFSEYPDEAYEKIFVDFYEKNYALLKQAGANDFRIFLDIYCFKQCNFEIFNKRELKKLAQYNVSLPISVYQVDN